MEYIKYLEELIPEKDSLKIVKSEAEKFYKTHSLDECFRMGHELYQSDNFQIQEVGVFLFGYAAHENADALSFLKNIVSQNDSWKVQEILAMAFDNHCKIIGYETALPVIQEWLNSDCANVRRAVSEGLRVWTSRPYFKDNPQVAIKLLAAHKSDESEYVRKSIGNAMRDISKKHSTLVSAELSTWDLSSKEIHQVYKLASKFISKWEKNLSVPDADTLIRLAEILEVSVSELLGTKIENENVASDVAEQLSRINEQLAIKNRRSRRIWKIVAIILAVIVLVNIFIAVFFSVPDLNSNTQNNPLAISDETISIDE